jgi:hypothetical protein
MHRTALPPLKNFPTKNVSGAEVKKLCPRVILLKQKAA